MSVTISGLPDAAALTGTEAVPIVQSGGTVRTTTLDIANLSTGATPGQNNVGYLNVPQNKQNNDYTLVLADAGKHIYTDDTGTHAWTIPPNSAVPFPIGAVITFVTFDPTDTNFTTITRGVGVSLFQSGTTTFLDADFLTASISIVTILQIDTDVWVLSGPVFEV